MWPLTGMLAKAVPSALWKREEPAACPTMTVACFRRFSSPPSSAAFLLRRLRASVSAFLQVSLKVSSVTMTPCAASQRYRGALRSAIANHCRSGLIRWPNSVASRPRSSRSNRRQFQMMTCAALLRCRKTYLFIQLAKCSSLGARVTPPPGLPSAMIVGVARITRSFPSHPVRAHASASCEPTVEARLSR